MRQTLRSLGTRFGLWIAQMAGWTPPLLSAPSHLLAGPQVELAVSVVLEVQRAMGEAPGPVKAREALRMLLNAFPQAKTRDLNFLMELALQRIG